jgi:nucleotide-binding universal stress UspA family protein
LTTDGNEGCHVSATDGQTRKVVVGVDGSPSSADALRWAARQADLMGAELHVVTTWDFPWALGYGPGVEGFDYAADARSVAESTVREVLGEQGGAKVQIHVESGHPAAQLLEEAKDADLLVVGSHGHGGFAGMLLGSVSQHVVAHAPCPTVVVRAPDADAS